MEPLLLNETQYPSQAAKQRQLLSILHTLQGGENIWVMASTTPERCDRCLHMSRNIMQITGTWPHG